MNLNVRKISFIPCTEIFFNIGGAEKLPVSQELSSKREDLKH